MKIKILVVSFILIGFIACNNKKRPQLQDNNITKLHQVSPQFRNGFNPTLDTSKAIDLKYSLEQLDNTKGLSNSSVNAIFQDSENLLWIGTWDGLNRYDGNSFKIFRPELDNENSLSNQVILKIDEDYAGKIWILTMHGINRYDKKTATFQRFYFTRKNKPPLSESEFNMALDASKKVFCAVKDWGIGYFDGNDFQKLKINNLSTKAVKKMEFTSSGELLVLFENKELYSLSLQKQEDGIYYNGGSWFRAEYCAYVVGQKHGWEKAKKLMENRAWAEINLNPKWPYSKEFIPTKWTTTDSWWPSTRGLCWNVFMLMADEVAGLRSPEMDPDYIKIRN